MRLSQKMLIVAAIPVVFELSIFGVLWSLVERLDQARLQESHARQVSACINKIGMLHIQRCTLLIMRHANASQRDALWPRVRAIAGEMHVETERLQKLTLGYPREHQLCVRMAELFTKIDHSFTSTTSTPGSSTDLSRALLILDLERDASEVNDVVALLSTSNLGGLKEQQDLIIRYNQQLKLAISIAAGVSIALALTLVTFLYRNTVSRFNQLMATTARLAANQRPGAPLMGSDEIAKIDKLCHSLYQSLETLRARERAVLDNAMDVIASLDADLRFTEVNEAALRQWGFETDELVGRRAVDLLPESEIKLFNNALKTLKDDGTASIVELKVRKLSGSLLETEWCLTRVANDDSLYLVVHDISQKKQVERMKREFASMISHDLRTPLNSVLLTLELLEMQCEDLLPPQSMQDLKVVAGNVRRLLSLVNNLLDIESMTDGKMKIFAEDCDLESIIDSAVGSVDALLRQKQVTVDWRGEANERLFCDRERIIQVVVNLLGNAIKFSPNNSRVTLRGKRQGNFLRLEIRDRGRGIPEEKIAHVFDRFYQVEGKEDRELKGTGLGLSICKAIVELHGGKIGVFAGDEGGCVFWFTIPLVKSQGAN